MEEKKENNEKKEIKEKAKDKIMTDFFLLNFLLKKSDILLLVLGDLTYSEQLLINKVKEESKKHKISKIFIIHNLQNFRKKEQVEHYINNTLLKCPFFNLIKPK